MENQNTTGGASSPMTYGEKAVGLTFNPAGDADVVKIKELYSQIIDICNNKRLNLDKDTEGEKARLFSVAITEAQTAQMWAVKAITFNI